MSDKKITRLDDRRKEPVERWRRQGVHVLLVPKPKRGQVKPFRKRGGREPPAE